MNAPIMPQVDGHSWIVRDGKLIDWNFKEYKLIQKIQGCSDRAVYMPTDQKIQNIIIATYKAAIMSMTKSKTWEGACDEYLARMKKAGVKRVACYNCIINCLMEQHLHGGEIVFGSMGWKKLDSDKVWWEFGGENYKINQFIKKSNATFLEVK